MKVMKGRRAARAVSKLKRVFSVMPLSLREMPSRALSLEVRPASTCLCTAGGICRIFGTLYMPMQLKSIEGQLNCSLFFFARSCLGKVPGRAPFSQLSQQATACTIRMQIVKQINKNELDTRKRKNQLGQLISK